MQCGCSQVGTGKGKKMRNKMRKYASTVDGECYISHKLPASSTCKFAVHVHKEILVAQ